ncbi:MAG: dihydroorotase [Sphingomonadaceae bacterium]|nr:dihydroorotase [Sphingomonadaceae bacterium]
MVVNVLAFTNARLIDPESGLDRIGALIVEDRQILSIDGPVPQGAENIDCAGRVLAPALIDAGVFKADAAACLAGGIARVLLMPDQSPPLDDPAVVERAQRIGKPHVWVHPLAAATRGLGGTELAEIGLMKLAGAVGVATGRGWIGDSGVMHRLMQYATAFDLVVVTHAEDHSLTGDAAATAGEFATRLGLPSAPAFAEALAVARDVRLAAATGARLHIRQVTTAESLDIIRRAKARGVRVTCGVTPAHMLLNDQATLGYRSFARLSPPLRIEADRLAILDALVDGTIDVIASGHDPRTQEDKRLPFADAAPGMVGAETLLALALGVVHDGRMALPSLLARLTSAPARLFGLPGGRLAPGEPADLVVFDPDSPWRIDADRFVASSDNTPFDGLPVQGRVAMTVKGGEIFRR